MRIFNLGAGTVCGHGVGKTTSTVFLPALPISEGHQKSILISFKGGGPDFLLFTETDVEMKELQEWLSKNFSGWPLASNRGPIHREPAFSGIGGNRGRGSRAKNKT